MPDLAVPRGTPPHSSPLLCENNPALASAQSGVREWLRQLLRLWRAIREDLGRRVAARFVGVREYLGSLYRRQFGRLPNLDRPCKILHDQRPYLTLFSDKLRVRDHVRRSAPQLFLYAAIVLQAIAGLALGLPGHLSSDSVVQLYEARTLQFISFNPPMMSLLLRFLEVWMPGTALFVVVDQALLTASFALLLAERKSELRWPIASAAALVVLNPLFVVYTGIVWKDVLMSHVAAFGYVCLFVAARRPEGPKRIKWALGAVFALAFVASLRQHALILAIPGATYAAFLLRRERMARWGLAVAFSAMIIGINVAIVAYADVVAVGEKIPRTAAGLRSLANFDLAGIAANGGVIPDPAVAAQVETSLVPSYTPLRNDPLPAPAQGSPLWRTETPQLLMLLGRSIMSSPGAYLSHRAANLGALLWRSGTAPLCAPVHFGVVSSVYVPYLGRDIVPELKLDSGQNLRDRWLARFAGGLLHTPLFNQVFWSIALAVAAAALWVRGGAGPLVVLAGSAFAFALAFGVVGYSCEFRYIYVVPVAATLLLLALATGGVTRPPVT